MNHFFDNLIVFIVIFILLTLHIPSTQPNTLILIASQAFTLNAHVWVQLSG
nr:MAG TPA: hypothetical protein [Caudoviricetes sp.]